MANKKSLFVSRGVRKKSHEYCYVVELTGAPGILPEDIVDILEGLFKHGDSVDD
jgi:hypothetical protein